MKKWIIIASLMSVACIGVLAALPVLLPIWQEHRPRPVVKVDSAMRKQVIDALLAQVGEHYVFPEKTMQIEALLRQRQRSGDYDAISNGDELAKSLTTDMATVAHDLHMRVEFSPEILPPQQMPKPGAPKQDAVEQGPFFMRWIDAIGRKMAKFGVQKAEILPSNIGYLELSAFFPPHLTPEKYSAAMDKLAETDAMIIDLRRNGGGSPESVGLLVSYFVEQRTRLNDIYDRDTGLTEQHWTQDKLPGKRYGARKKVVVLVGPNTRSAGEDFAYTLQAMKRATVIGASTWGGAHPTAGYRLNDHFIGVIPNRRSISPITKTNWEGVGVMPDIVATPAGAMSAAKAYLLNSAPRDSRMRHALPVL